MDPTEETARLNAEEYIKAQAEATRWAMRCGVEKSLKEQALARIAELEAELKSIADAKYTTWDDGYNTPQDFVAWVQNRCRFLLKH